MVYIVVEFQYKFSIRALSIPFIYDIFRLVWFEWIEATIQNKIDNEFAWSVSQVDFVFTLTALYRQGKLAKKIVAKLE